MTRILGSSRSPIVASRRVRRRQDDNRAPRPPHPSLRNHRNRQRELALQTPRLSATPACPRGQTGTSHARRSVAREGTARRARDPPIRYRDKPVPMPGRGPSSMPIRGPDCSPIDNWKISESDYSERELLSHYGRMVFAPYISEIHARLWKRHTEVPHCRRSPELLAVRIVSDLDRPTTAASSGHHWDS